MRCKADVLYLKRVLPLFLLVSLMDSFAGSIVRLSAHDEVCNGWTSIDNYTVFFLCVLRTLCGEPCIFTFQSGSYLAWQLGQMRIILQVSFVNRTNDVWKPSSYPHWGQTWSSFFIFIETCFGVLLSNTFLLLFHWKNLAVFCSRSLEKVKKERGRKRGNGEK